MGGPQENQHDAIVEALSQWYLNNEQDTIHNQEVMLGPFQRPKITIKPQQKLIETIQGKNHPKNVQNAYIMHMLHMFNFKFLLQSKMLSMVLMLKNGNQPSNLNWIFGNQQNMGINYFSKVEDSNYHIQICF